MKEATGELNMTVVTLIAIAAIAALFYFVIWPIVQRTLVTQTCKTYGDGWTAVKVTSTNSDGGTNDTVGSGQSEAKISNWACCPAGVTTYSTTNCIAAN